MTNIKEIIEGCRLMEADRGSYGWPDIRMETVTALCDEVERLQSDFNELFSAADDIRHWHDRESIGGMVVSAEAVHRLWEVLDKVRTE